MPNKNLLALMLPMLIAPSFVFADIGTWTKVKKSHVTVGYLVNQYDEVSLYDEFSYGPDVVVEMQNKPFYNRATLDKRNLWLKVEASHSKQCDVALVDQKDQDIEKLKVETNKIYQGVFRDIGGEQMKKVSRIDVSCDNMPKPQNLRVGEEIRCKKDGEKFVVFLGEWFSPEQKKAGVEVRSVRCVAESEAACPFGWKQIRNDKTMVQCVRE